MRLSNGLAVLGYERDAEGNGKFLLGHWDEKWSYASLVSRSDSPDLTTRVAF